VGVIRLNPGSALHFIDVPLPPPRRRPSASPAARWKKEHFALLAGVASASLHASIPTVRAETFTWVGADSAPWGVAANWDRNDVPSSGDHVIIGQTRALVVDIQEAGTIDLIAQGLTIGSAGQLTFQDLDLKGGDATNNGKVIGSVSNASYVNNLGIWTGAIKENSGEIVNVGGGTWNGDILSNNKYIDNNDRYDTWNGDIWTNNDDIFNGGTWNGHIVTNDDFISNYYSYAIWNGDVRANNLAIYNAGTWNGDVLGNAGEIENGQRNNNDLDAIWNGDVRANTGTIYNVGTWNGSLTSAGTLILENRVNGAITSSGKLQVVADLSGITALTNTGIITMTDGHATQTLSAASASFGANSILQIDVDAAGASDRISLTGAAILGGQVAVTTLGGTYDAGTTYTILTATSISGRFAAVTVDLAFLAPRLSQDATTVTLAFTRNDVPFASLGDTLTQIEIGTIVQALGAGNALHDAALWLTAGEAAGAFDTLSGEAHLDTQQALMQGAALVAASLTDRIDQSFTALGFTGGNVSGYAPVAPPPEAALDNGLWGQLYGTSSVSTAADAPATAMTAAGLVAGLDGMLGDWRLGLMLNGGATRSEFGPKGASAASTDYGLGLYAGREWGQTRLALGATYTAHDIQSARHVAVADFSQTLTASYGAATSLAFTQLSHEFDFGAVSVTPFGSLAYVRHDTDGFAETGGATALGVEASLVDATYMAVGVGIARQMALDNGVLVTARGSLGWRHTVAERSAATHHFLTGGSFSVVGAPVETDALLVGTDLTFDLDGSRTIDLHYDGRLGTRTHAHALNLTWTSHF
jgi:uncharacterized protein with beta-barrel porin domain